MSRRAKILAGIAGVAVLGTAAGIGTALATGGDSEASIKGGALAKASRAALDHTGGGKVTDTEVGDEEGYYEVEVTLDNGSQLDVHLDSHFNVIGEEKEHGKDDD